MRRVKRNRTLLKVKRYSQISQECGIAAVSSVANFYNQDVEYHDVRQIVDPNSRSYGMYVPEQAILLNKLGYNKISIVTNDLEIFDYGWNRYSNKSVLGRLKKIRQHFYKYGDKDYSGLVGCYMRWLSMEGCYNRIRTDHDFAKYIRRYLRNGRPVIVMLNWNAMYKCSKAKSNNVIGYSSSHSVVIRGYDSQDVFIADSDGYRSKNGYYKLNWSKFLPMVYELILVG